MERKQPVVIQGRSIERKPRVPRESPLGGGPDEGPIGEIRYRRPRLLEEEHRPVSRPMPRRTGGARPAPRSRSGVRYRTQGGRSGAQAAPPMALAGKSLIAGSLLLLIFLINLIPLPLARGLIGHVRTAVTQDMDWEETLGQLKFVGDKLPDVQSVFRPRPSETPLPEQEPRETDTLAAPAQGEVVAFFEPAAEGRYGRPGIEVLVGPEALVYAAAAGRVAAVERHEYYGTCVWISHGENMFTFYGGLGDVIVQSGDPVAQGAPLADTAEGPDGRHILHFQVWVEETPVDPLPFLPVQGPGEPGAGVV